MSAWPDVEVLPRSTPYQEPPLDDLYTLPLGSRDPVTLRISGAKRTLEFPILVPPGMSLSALGFGVTVSREGLIWKRIAPGGGRFHDVPGSVVRSGRFAFEPACLLRHPNQLNFEVAFDGQGPVDLDLELFCYPARDCLFQPGQAHPLISCWSEAKERVQAVREAFLEEEAARLESQRFAELIDTIDPDHVPPSSDGMRIPVLLRLLQKEGLPIGDLRQQALSVIQLLGVQQMLALADEFGGGQSAGPVSLAEVEDPAARAGLRAYPYLASTAAIGWSDVEAIDAVAAGLLPPRADLPEST